MHILLNALLFQLAWWICVLSVNNDFEIKALLLCSLLGAVQLHLSQAKEKDLKLLATVLPVGIGIDTLIQQLGLMDFYGWTLSGMSPFWLWMIWIQFIMTINHSLRFINDLAWPWVALLGFVFGPLSYFSGAKLGAASSHFTWLQTTALCLIWATVLPLVVWINKHEDAKSLQHNVLEP